VLYLFDANVLITANNTYYPIDQVKEYWAWLQYQGETGNIKLPAELWTRFWLVRIIKRARKMKTSYSLG
jgi:hypothetical protein